jgi:basic amino acid/polyamine antiporter, APA family
MDSPETSKNKLGLWTTTSLVMGNMIGAGIFLIPSTLASFGGISIIGWVLSASGALMIAAVFSRLSKLLPNVNGGPYAYTRRGFGDFTGFLIAWGYWISVWTSNAAIAVSFVSALSTFVPVLNGNPAAAILTGLSAIWFLTWVNTRGIVATGRMQLVTTILKLIPLLMIAMGGLFYIRTANFFPLNISGHSNFSAITATAATTFFAFLGIECATIPARNVDNPARTIPIATMAGTIIVALIYILGTVSLMGIISPKELQLSVTPFADAAARIWGNQARYWIAAGAVMASFGTLNGWLLIQGQIPYATAKDHLFPAIFGKENKKGVPAVGIIIGSLLVSGLMMMNYSRGLVDQFRFLILLATLTCVVPYLFSMAAYLVIRLENKHTKSKSWVSSILLGSLAFIFAFWIIGGSGEEIVYWGFLLMIAGIPFYLWVSRNKKNNSEK